MGYSVARIDDPRYIKMPQSGKIRPTTQPQGPPQISATARPFAMSRIRDLVELGKPRLSLLVIFTSAMGMWLAAEPAPLLPSIVFLLATSCLVAAANTLNCWIEIEIDGLMRRTRERPLPAGRLRPHVALASGSVLSIVALTALYASTNLLTTGLGAIALVSYVLVYTPLKRITPWALLVGTLPGALPPLMGWTAATGEIAAPGLFAFGLLVAWQLPHFVAISIYLEDDFRRGGIRVIPVVHGPVVARRYVIGFAFALVAFTLLALPLGMAGWYYTAIAAATGVYFCALCYVGLRESDEISAWARRVFGFTLLHLPLLLIAFVLDR